MTPLQKNIIHDKYLGSLLGAIIGDAIGWPQEDRSMKVGKRLIKPQKTFQKWERKNGGGKYPHIEEINEGEYSDDSQLMLATARSLLQGDNWYSHFVKLELPVWLLYERGGGGATKKACKLWQSGNPPWKSEKKNEVAKYFQAGGNGVVMRILPHVFSSYNDKDEMRQQVFKNGIATHGHPRALLSAIFYAYAIHYLVSHKGTLGYGELVDYLIKNKEEWSIFPTINRADDWLNAANTHIDKPYEEVWNTTVNELVEGLQMIKRNMSLGIMDSTEDTLKELKCFDKKFRGAGTVSALISVYIASKYATEPTTGLLEVSFLKEADTDTIASMAGGLLGAIYGTEWLNSDWYKVQDCKYIKNITNSLYKKDIVESEKTPLWSYSHRGNFLDTIEEMKNGDSTMFGPFNKVVLIDKIQNRVLVQDVLVTTYKFLTELGQTLYIKIIKESQSKKKLTSYKPLEKESINEKNKLINSNNQDDLSNFLFKSLNQFNVSQILADILKFVVNNNEINANTIINVLEKHGVDKKYLNQLTEIVNSEDSAQNKK
ncbi:ADP-ribosylglycohydrolase family protein [Priestia aryabhattai]|uniref:ADP-ribosylglycohydrolase family protein n=2 Tax=Priestia aryabhattai TaxID=412384 RepID=UPI003CF5520B